MTYRKPVTGHGSSHENKRIVICDEAARIMDEHGIRDFHWAKAKAVERLGVGRRFPLPSNREVERALQQRLRLFKADHWARRCRLLWQTAIEIMVTFESFEPRLAGALLRETVTDRTPVEIHLFADSPEEVTQRMFECTIPFEAFDKRVRTSRRVYALVPGFRFACTDVSIELLAFGGKDIREAPLCPVDGRPMSRVSLARAREILAEASPGS